MMGVWFWSVQEGTAMSHMPPVPYGIPPVPYGIPQVEWGHEQVEVGP